MIGLPFRLVLVTLVLVLAVGLVAASGLTTLTIDRTVQAMVVADNDNAAVKLECLPDYEAVCSYDEATGVVTLQLHKALGEGADGFNPNAVFALGSQDEPVLQITNNSGISVEVWLTSAPEDVIRMYNESGVRVKSDRSAEVISPGSSHHFYFEIHTPELDDLEEGQPTATLRIREAD